MKNISEYIVYSEILLVSLVILIFALKTIMFFMFEKYWDSLKFFYYSKVDIKMTNIKVLKAWRKRQNTMTITMAVLLAIFTVLYSFHQVVLD